MESAIKEKEMKISAGRMMIDNGKVKPDPSKGEIRIFRNRDQLLIWQWRSLEKEDDHELVIFEGEWEWIRVQTGKGRVYKLQNKVFEDDMFFYWMQNPKVELDQEIDEKIARILNTGKLEDEDVKKEEAGSTNQNNQTNLNNNNNNQNKQQTDFLKTFTEAFGKLEKAKYPKLSQILSKKNINKYLSDEDRKKLFELLPEGQRSLYEFENNISSPQYAQALDSFNYVLTYENALSVIQSFGLDAKYAQNFPNGVEAFIKAMIQKFGKKPEE